MTLTERDRKIVFVILPVVVLAAFWFLLLAPQRKEAQRIGDEVGQAEVERDQAVALANEAESSKDDFKTDYAALLTLGKAIPSTVDMPSLLVQLDSAASGTDITFTSVRAGERQPTTTPAATNSSAPTEPSGDAAAGGAAASTGAGQAAEAAGEAVQTSDQASSAAGAEPAPPGAGQPVPSLDQVPLEFTFDGSFFRLADFFHQLKRFVKVNGHGVDVHGRLMTIDSLILKPTVFPRIEAQVVATVYLSPKSQGVSAGATPSGPAQSTTGASPPQAASAEPVSSPTPTATAAVK